MGAQRQRKVGEVEHGAPPARRGRQHRAVEVSFPTGDEASSSLVSQLFHGDQPANHPFPISTSKQRRLKEPHNYFSWMHLKIIKKQNKRTKNLQTAFYPIDEQDEDGNIRCGTHLAPSIWRMMAWGTAVGKVAREIVEQTWRTHSGTRLQFPWPLDGVWTTRKQRWLRSMFFFLNTHENCVSFYWDEETGPSTRIGLGLVVTFSSLLHLPYHLVVNLEHCTRRVTHAIFQSMRYMISRNMGNQG